MYLTFLHCVVDLAGRQLDGGIWEDIHHSSFII